MGADGYKVTLTGSAQESRSYPGNLREHVEVGISAVEEEVVLHDQGGNPYIIARDRGSGHSQLAIQVGIVARGRHRGELHLHPFTAEKELERVLIFAAPSSDCESGPEFCDHYKGHMYAGGSSKHGDCIRFSLHEVPVPVGVDCDL